MWQQNRNVQCLIVQHKSIYTTLLAQGPSVLVHSTLFNSFRDRDCLSLYHGGLGSIGLNRYQQHKLLYGAQECRLSAFSQQLHLSLSYFTVFTLDGFGYSPQRPVITMSTIFFHKNYVASVEISSRTVPFASFLQCLHVLASPSNPELVCEVLDSSPTTA